MTFQTIKFRSVWVYDLLKIHQQRFITIHNIQVQHLKIGVQNDVDVIKKRYFINGHEKGTERIFYGSVSKYHEISEEGSVKTTRM